MPLVGPIPDTLLPLRGRYSVANKPKALSAGTPPELGTKIRTEGRAVLVSAKTMPCPNKLGPTLSHGVHAEFTQSHTECTESHTLANADQDCPTVSRFDSIGQSSPEFAELRRRSTDSAKPNDSVRQGAPTRATPSGTDGIPSRFYRVKQNAPPGQHFGGQNR
jgi:hypothetical protein